MNPRLQSSASYFQDWLPSGMIIEIVDINNSTLMSLSKYSTWEAFFFGERSKSRADTYSWIEFASGSLWYWFLGQAIEKLVVLCDILQVETLHSATIRSYNKLQKWLSNDNEEGQQLLICYLLKVLCSSRRHFR